MKSDHKAKASWESLVRPAICRLVPYSSARSQTGGGEKLVYLDANENPFAADDRGYNRYPDPQPLELIQLFSELYQVKPEQVLVSSGSEAAIDHLIRVFCECGKDAIVTTPPTFMMYEIWAKIQCVNTLHVPLKGDDLHLDVEAIKATWTSGCKMLFLTTPNNPMGSLVRPEDILELCAALRGRGIVVVDEAYQEFSDQPSVVSYIPDHDNLVVLRTLSKAYGLAAARCAALLGCPELVACTRKVMAAYPIPKTSVDVVLEAMTFDKRRQRLADVQTLKSERERLIAALTGHPKIKRVFPSSANFVLLEVYDVESFLSALYKAGIVARDRRSDWPNAVRLTVGTPAENDRVLRCLR